MTDLFADRFTRIASPTCTTSETPDKDRDTAVVAFTAPRTNVDLCVSVVRVTDAGSEVLNLGKWCTTIINLGVP
jgi:hypothetical protein